MSGRRGQRRRDKDEVEMKEREGRRMMFGEKKTRTEEDGHRREEGGCGRAEMG